MCRGCGSARQTAFVLDGRPYWRPALPPNKCSLGLGICATAFAHLPLLLRALFEGTDVSM